MFRIRVNNNGYIRISGCVFNDDDILIPIKVKRYIKYVWYSNIRRSTSHMHSSEDKTIRECNWKDVFIYGHTLKQ